MANEIDIPTIQVNFDDDSLTNHMGKTLVRIEITKDGKKCYGFVSAYVKNTNRNGVYLALAVNNKQRTKDATRYAKPWIDQD